MGRIELLGPAGSGKTTLGTRLATELGWPLLGIDTERANGGDWPSLLAKVHNTTTHLLVESVLLTRAYKDELRQHDASLLHTHCETAERLTRLQERGPAQGTPGRERYTPRYKYPSMRVIDTTMPTNEATILVIVEWCQQHHG